MTISQNPAFNLKVVLKETGIAADTLRAWERRYGLPMPERTPGGHRLYSQRDIETIKWLMRQQSEGLSISRAVDLWNELTASGADPLAGSISTALGIAPAVPDTTLDSLRARWIQACMEFSEPEAEQTLNQAFSMFPVEAVCMDVLQKGMSEIGELWYENRASVQQEHFASGLAMRRLDALLSAVPAPTRNKTILAGCPPEEWHTFTPLLLALFLRRRGLNVIYLGANVPVQRFTDTVKSVKADLVVLVAQQLISAATLQQTALALSMQGIPVAFGGRIFTIRPNLTDTVPGYFLGSELNEATGEIEKVLRGKSMPREPKAASQVYVTAHQSFVSTRTRIELTLKELLEPLAISPEDIETGIHFLGENIAAALQLGDMAHVSAEIDWLKNLLKMHNTPSQQLIHFMETYSRAIDVNINGQGKPIFEWISAEVQKLKAT
jgi:methanogenic corrinoid protein MtbC1